MSVDNKFNGGDLEAIEKGIELLKKWNGSEKVVKFRKDLAEIYRRMEKMKKIEPNQREFDIALGFYDEQLVQVLLDEIKIDGLRRLMIYLLDNDDRYNSEENADNYENHKPFPFYLIYFVYGILYFSDIKDLRDRALFESFWEHQARIRRGLDEQYTRKFLDPFIDAGVTTVNEIQELCIKDWHRWQNSSKDLPYYGAPLGPSTWYFPNYSWGVVQRKLEEEWRKITGKEPKKWGE